MPTIIEFLEARIAEDEKVARSATSGCWEVDAMDAGHSRYEMNVWVTAGAVDVVCDMDGLARSRNEAVALDDGYKDAQHITRHDPARVLAECASKRRMLSNIPKMSDEFNPIGGTSEFVLRCLCFPYMGHPDYNHDEWAL